MAVWQCAACLSYCEGMTARQLSIPSILLDPLLQQHAACCTCLRVRFMASCSILRDLRWWSISCHCR